MPAPSLLFDPMNLSPGTHVGDWCVLARVGWGGYGAVYLVRHVREPRRQGALKLALKLGTLSRRLEREVELLVRVKHPHVVRLVDAGHWAVPGSTVCLPFVVMEYVPGMHLYARLSQREARVREALALFEQSALALHALHEAQVVHRDVKGPNLLVREDDGLLVLVDLGVGDYAGAFPLTGTTLPPGSSDYRSPEALRFQREHLEDSEAHYEFQRADDLYALGVTWYRALTGAYPLATEREWHLARLEGRALDSPCALNPRIPPDVGALVLRLLAPRAEERPASAREVAETLATLRHGGGGEWEALLFEWSEVAATPRSLATELPPRPAHEPPRDEPSPFTRPWRWGALVLGLVLAILLVAGLFNLAHPTQEGPSMSESKVSTPASPTSAARLSPLELDFMKSLAAAVCLVTSGCAGVPAQPSWPRDCPPETLAAMASRGMEPGEQNEFQLYIHDQGEVSDFTNSQPGPIVSVIGSRADAVSWFPVGTKLYGFMWTGGEKVQAYWTEAHLPDGQKVPVCLVLGFDERGGYWKDNPGTQPGTFRISKRAPATVTRRFERPE
jgi:serine/threonine-protein kinase